jgi:biotin transport system substrate-specific component
MEAILQKEIISNKALCRLIGVVLFVICTAIGAFVRIPLPFTPVPLTLQTFFVLLAGAFLGPRLGAVTQMSYIALGVSGLPIFASAAGGIWYMLGPTGGYIIGFVLASFFIGALIRRMSHSFFSVLALFCCADLLILSVGSLWLKVMSGAALMHALWIGFFPFVAGDLLKAIAAATLYYRMKSRLEEIF